MTKRVLIISPYFPPFNAADMQRIRMSLPYLEEFGWESEIVTIDPQYSDMVKDELLTESIPGHIKIHKIKAFDKKWTSKFGLGSIALRSLWFYRKKVNELLSVNKFDLVYFSTTQFPVCILGSYWKKRAGVPYVIDMQDPWHSEYYKGKPKDQRPPKYWFSYWMNKWLEPISMEHVDGLIAVSEQYINDLKSRYPIIKNIPAATIPFGAFEPDMEIAERSKYRFERLIAPVLFNIVYIGRGGADMHNAVSVLFCALKQAKQGDNDLVKKLKLHFIGTSYAPKGQGKPTILPLARQYGVDEIVIESTDRVSYYHTLLTLKQADVVFIAGSDDPKYTASKLYPYLATQKPLLAIFNSGSPALKVLREYGAQYSFSYDSDEDVTEKVTIFLKDLLNNTLAKPAYNREAVEKYSAENMTRQQCILFDEVVNKMHVGK